MAGSSGSQRSSRRKLYAKAFARRLRAIMEERGLTAGETARRMREHLGGDAKFTPANISHYRLGRSLPRPRYLDALSFVLGGRGTNCSPANILRRNGRAGANRRQKHIPAIPAELPRRSTSSIKAGASGCRSISNSRGRSRSRSCMR